jgi:hypothetical protein
MNAVDRSVPNFTLIAEGLDVAPALAELAALPDYYWLQINADKSVYFRLLKHDDTPVLEDELPETWRLIGQVRTILAEQHGDTGTFTHCRVGRMPPGEGLPPHYDGIDGIRHRRYQLALQSEPGVELIVGGELKCPRPGEAWRIEASRTHSVHNHSPVDRITILFDTVAAETPAP